MNLIKAVIFDMDGVLIDSEPLWRQAEMQAFQKVGITLTEEMCIETMGLRVDEVVRHWHSKYPWQDTDLKQVENDVVTSVRQLILLEGRSLEGVHSVLSALKEAGFKIGLASSSPMNLIDAVVDRLEIRDYFEILCSAAEEEFGKPHPAVYFKAASLLNIDPVECCALEDSLSGIRSAGAAGMFVIAVPSPDQYDDPRFSEADVKIRSLLDFPIDDL